MARNTLKNQYKEGKQLGLKLQEKQKRVTDFTDDYYHYIFLKKPLDEKLKAGEQY